MPEPIALDAETPRFAFPLLYAGQAQKEVLVNEALSMLDTLTHCVVEGILQTPPSQPAIGQAWIVAAEPAEGWSQNAGDIAAWSNGTWRFYAAVAGMRVYDRQAGVERRFDGLAWSAPTSPLAPEGGTTIDVEARQAVVNLLQRLRDAGILA